MAADSKILKLATVSVTVLITILLAEGAWSLATGDSLLFPRPILRSQMLDAERMAAAALTEGPFQLDTDPVVGFRTKAGAQREFFGVPAKTDEHGMRQRLGAAPEPGAARIVVLGDSYVFGFGVGDDQTIAHHLEAALAATVAAGAARPVAFSVASTGWNFANQQRYLLGHWARYEPDVVVVMPIANDLDDGYGVNEAGQLHKPSTVDGPFVGLDQYTAFLIGMARLRRELGGSNELRWPLLLTDVAPESQRRWDAWVEGLRDLRGRLAARGAHLLVAYPDNDNFALVAQARLRRAMPDLVQLPLLGPRGAGDTLAEDPHPSGRWNAGAARTIAAAVLERGWLPGGDPSELPPLDERYVGKQFALRSDEEYTMWRAAWTAVFGPVVDLEDFTGFPQIYGGVDVDGTVGPACMLGLRPPEAGARELVVAIATLPAELGLNRSALTIEVHSSDGLLQQAVFEIPDPTAGGGASAASFTLALPAGARIAGGVDVRLRASNWIVEVHEGTSRLAALRLRRVELR